MSPVLPSQVQALVISPSDSWCVAFKKLLHSAYLMYLLIRYENDDDGEITDLHGSDICSTDCVETETE